MDYNNGYGRKAAREKRGKDSRDREERKGGPRGTQQRDDLSFCVVNLQCSRRVDTQTAIESILGALRGPITGSGEVQGQGEDEDEDYLAILTAQAPLRPMQNLQKQKQRVISSGGASVFTWDHSQEKQLLLEARKANKGQICFLTCADTANKPEETK